MNATPKLLDDLLSVYDNYRMLTDALSEYKEITLSTTWRLHNLKIKKPQYKHKVAIESLWEKHFQE